MEAIQLNQVGTSNKFSGYTPDKRFFVEIGWHVGKKQFFVDIDNVAHGQRVHLGFGATLGYLTYAANEALKTLSFNAGYEICLSKGQIHMLRMNEFAYAAANNLVLSQFKNCLAN